MNREEYWNENYAKYWKEMTDEAEKIGSYDSNIKKVSGRDYKTPGKKNTTDFFEEITYRKNDVLLDYGCGLGRFFPYFSEKCCYYGIDISKAMIAECKKTWPEKKERFIVSEGENLPFEDCFFDRVICNGVFDACYQEQALKEMIRVLKKGGYLLISGKNDLYYSDDEEAYIAERNARKKGHPNYFTDVGSMLEQIKDTCGVVCERYALRRGDFSKGEYEERIPDTFYEWKLILKKMNDRKEEFDKFSDKYSKTWKILNDVNE